MVKDADKTHPDLLTPQVLQLIEKKQYRNAVDLIVQTLHEGLLRHLALKTGNADDAKDIAQRIYIDLLKAVENFRGDSKAKTWLYRIAHYHFAQWRQHKSRGYEHLPSWQEAELLAPSLSSHERQEEERKLIALTLQLLSPEEREIISLFHDEEFSFAEIATIKGLKESTARKRCERARDKFEKVYQRERDKLR